MVRLVEEPAISERMFDRAERSSLALLAECALVVLPLNAILASLQHAASLGSFFAQTPAGPNTGELEPVAASVILLQSTGVGEPVGVGVETAKPMTKVFIGFLP